MPDYDFHTLSPVDFEALTRDLLQASQNIVFQSFKVGRDRGVDLLYSGGGGEPHRPMQALSEIWLPNSA